jgi:hypothetical protein
MPSPCRVAPATQASQSTLRGISSSFLSCFAYTLFTLSRIHSQFPLITLSCLHAHIHSCFISTRSSHRLRPSSTSATLLSLTTTFLLSTTILPIETRHTKWSMNLYRPKLILARTSPDTRRSLAVMTDYPHSKYPNFSNVINLAQRTSEIAWPLISSKAPSLLH